MTINEILENENIKPDRFGYAAISYIFKAFGDNIRSKEYWPWSEKVNCPWTESQGTKNDLQTAINILNKTYQITDNNIEEEPIGNSSIRNLQRRLLRSSNIIKTSDTITDKINETSNDTKVKTLEIEN